MIKDEKTFSSFYLYNQHKELFCHNPKKIFIQYKNSRIDLLTGERHPICVTKFVDELEFFQVQSYIEKPIVIHLFFELGYFCNDLMDKIPENQALAIYIEYQEFKIEEIYKYEYKEAFSFDAITMPKLEDYQKQFSALYQHLVDGDCYQVNLTLPVYLRMKEYLEPKSILQFLWRDALKVGAYAHGSYIHTLDTFYLSNSPECLFQVKEKNNNYSIETMPIKGTMPVTDESKRLEAWEKLVASKKDQAELYMITDLMRNDLSKIEMTPSKVTHKKCALNVPGLVHQFSVIEAEIKKTTTIKNIVQCLFPGGSITGAPKKRVLELINQYENHQRGFYCGSTLLLFKNKKLASINIRSAQINYSENEVTYGSGGAVTLLSECKDEYDEIFNKLKSFLMLLDKN